MDVPTDSGSYFRTHAHDTKFQRSDLKSVDPSAWPLGHGLQGDVVRIFTQVRDLPEEAETIPNVSE